MPDIASSSTTADELALVGVSKSVGDIWVEVRDASDGTLVAPMWALRSGNTSPFSPCGVEIVPDMNADGVDELAVLCRNPSNDYPYVLIRDAEDGSIVNNIAYDRTFLPW